jgi:hypothetical protein
MLSLAVSLVPTSALADSDLHARIARGMTITQVQALIGAPSAIKSLREKEVMFFCPTPMFGLFIQDPIYTRVYLERRRVVASETLIAPNMGTCEQFLAAFQWTDPLPNGVHTLKK